MNSSIPGLKGQSPENTSGSGDGGTRHSTSSESKKGRQISRTTQIGARGAARRGDDAL